MNPIRLCACVALLLGACATTSDVIPVGAAARGGATATLRVPSDLTVIQIDGEPVNLPIALSNPYNLSITPGPHTIFLRFDAIVGRGAGSYPVKSEPIALRTEIPAGATYTFRYERPKYDASRAVVRDLTVAIIDVASGQLAGSQVAEKPAEATTVLSVGGGNTAGSGSQNPVERMIYWWQQGSVADRAAFRAWLDAQDGS